MRDHVPLSLIVHQPHLPNRVVKICVRAYVCMSVREVSVRLSAACECARSYLCLWPVMQIQPSLCLGRGGSRSAWRCLCLCLFLRLCKRVWLCYVLESTQLGVRGRVSTCVCVRDCQNVSVREWSHDMLRATDHVFVGVGPSSGCVAERAGGMRAGAFVCVPVSRCW